MFDQKYHGTFAEYSRTMHEMDSIYGGPEYNNKKQIKGRKTLFQIVRFLSTHRCSTCEEIALYEIKQDPKSKRKVKSVTDDIRKFILNNLVPRKLVKEEGTRKKFNREIQAYSLDHSGVLYAIHLLSKNKSHKTYSQTVIYDESIIRNLAVEYSEYLPFVFDRLDVLKSILGKDWLDYLRLHEIVSEGLDVTGHLVYGSLDAYDSLNDYVTRSPLVFLQSKSPTENFEFLSIFYEDKKSWTNLQNYLKINDPWGMSITLLTYNTMLGRLEREYYRSKFVIEQDPKLIRKEVSVKYKKIFEGQIELWTWYKLFVDSAIQDMKKNMKRMKNLWKLIDTTA